MLYNIVSVDTIRHIILFVNIYFLIEIRFEKGETCVKLAGQIAQKVPAVVGFVIWIF